MTENTSRACAPAGRRRRHAGSVRSKLRRGLLVTAGAVLVIAAPSLLPRPLGTSTYVVTNGISMLPSIQSGDLVIARAASEYEVGDVVAFHSDVVNTTVLHRVVEVDGEQLVTKGDNNSWFDPELPTQDDVLGRIWLHLPGGGKMLAWLATPLHAAGLAASVSVLAGIAGVRSRRRRGHLAPKKRSRRAMDPKASASMRTVGSWFAVAGAALLALGVLAVTQPATETVGEEATFTQHVAFAYSTPPAPPLYPDGILTGEPVFLRLAQQVSLEITHRIESETATDLEGTVTVAAMLTGSGGWRRSIPLLPPRPLDDVDTTVVVTLDLPALHLVAEETAALTGAPTGTLRVAVTPTIGLVGTVAGQPVKEAFAPALAFSLDAVALRPEAGSGPEVAADSALTPSKAGTVTVPTSVPATLSHPLPGPDPTVTAARALGLAGGLSLLLLAGLLALIGRRRRNDEPARIAVRHRGLLVSIENAGGAPRGVTFDVSSFEALARVAEHHECLVLHHTLGDVHTYLVELDGTAYRYRVAVPSPTKRGRHSAGPRHGSK